MKIKIGSKIYDSEDQPIMVILSAQDKVNINAMLTDATKYCIYDETKYSTSTILKWMGTDND